MRIRWDQSLQNLAREPRVSSTARGSMGARSTAAPRAHPKETDINGVESTRRWELIGNINYR